MTLKHMANHPEVVGLLWLPSDLHFGFQCRGRGSIPGQGTKKPYANPASLRAWPKKKINKNGGLT